MTGGVDSGTPGEVRLGKRDRWCRRRDTGATEPELKPPENIQFRQKSSNTGKSRARGGPFPRAPRSARSLAAGNRILRRRCLKRFSYRFFRVVKSFDHLKKLKFSKVVPTAFTERGLYMLETYLKVNKP